MKYFRPDQEIIFSRGVLQEKGFFIKERIEYEDEKYKIIILPGFFSDGASISIGRYTVGCPFEKKYLAAALIHDALYATKYLSRKEADVVFHKALGDLNVENWRVNLMYGAVRVAGWVAWSKKDPESVQNAQKYIEIERK